VDRSDEAQNAHNAVDDDVARAYVDLIPSVPHGTPPVRHNGLRSARSADRHKGTVWSASLTTSQSVAEPLRADDLHAIGCEPDRLLRWRVLRTTPGNEAAFLRRNARLDGRVIDVTVTARSTTPADDAGLSPHPRSNNGASTATSTRRSAPPNTTLLA
jgi:hypothetical protein